MHNKLFLNHLELGELASVYTCPLSAEKYPVRNKGRIHCGFIYTIEGTETYHFKDQVLKAEPGSVLFIPQGAEYTVTLDGEMSVVVVVDFSCRGQKPKAFTVDFGSVNGLKNLFCGIARKWERKSSDYIPDCKSDFYRLLALMSNRISKQSSDSKELKIQNAEKALRESCMREEFSIEKLSGELGMSRRYFELLFRRCYGITPKAYVLSVKMERGKELLLSEKLSLEDVAAMLGYGSVYHFGKIFKSKTGYSPGEYRRSRGL